MEPEAMLSAFVPIFPIINHIKPVQNIPFKIKLNIVTTYTPSYPDNILFSGSPIFSTRFTLFPLVSQSSFPSVYIPVIH
jgi:hypothetical protein